MKKESFVGKEWEDDLLPSTVKNTTMDRISGQGTVIERSTKLDKKTGIESWPVDLLMNLVPISVRSLSQAIWSIRTVKSYWVSEKIDYLRFSPIRKWEPNVKVQPIQKIFGDFKTVRDYTLHRNL